MSLTLEDIARISGTSRSTVSRVINGEGSVREATREKINRVIRDLNFQPNLVARGLAGGRTGLIGFMIPLGVQSIFRDPFFPLLLQGISNGCATHNYSAMLWMAELEYKRRMISRLIYNGLVEGVIVSSMLSDEPLVEALADSKLPFVLIGRHPALPHISYIDIDNRKSVSLAVTHLIQQKCQRIATITGPLTMMVGQDRLQGYRDALLAQGRPVEERWIVEGDFTEEGGYQAMRHLLTEKPDAVFAASDAMAMGAMGAILEAGLKIPEDVAVMGFDDVVSPRPDFPGLTTVRQPIQDMGARAAETLIYLIQNPQEDAMQLVLPAELVIRQSTGGGDDRNDLPSSVSKRHNSLA